MLKIFKKSGRRRDQHKSPAEEIPRDVDGQRRRHSAGGSSTSTATLAASEEACEGRDDDGENFRSRLSKNLLEILSEKSSLCYFVQFLEERKGLPLIKFWLDVEAFRTSAQVCEKSEAFAYSNHKPKSTSSEGCDDLSYFSVDCDSVSMNSSSERFSAAGDEICDIRRTEDEKSMVSDDLSGRLSKITEFIANQEDSILSSYSNLCDISMGQPGEEGTSASGQEEALERKRQEEEEITKVQRSIATDAVRIFRKYFTSNSAYWIDIPPTIHAQISLALCTDGSSPVSPYCFEEAQKLIFRRLEKDHLNDFLDSVFYCKYCVDVLTSDNLQLRDILYSESALFYFLEFLEQENLRDYLDFWVSATNFRRQFCDSGDRMVFSEAQSDAMVLYEKYFSLQANTSLQFSDTVRFHVEERICSQTEPIFTCFDRPVRIVEHFLEANHFAAFAKSQLFYKYLSELLNRIQEHRKATGEAKKSHRKTQSDCSSVNTARSLSISAQNTLLAMETPQKHRAIRSASTSDMQIDARHISDPDLLWRRSSLSHGLSFGRINALGRYERDFEMDNEQEERWSLSAGGTKLKKAMRKLVNLPEEKVQEEIAWQVAEMIIKDVTNVTQKNHDTET